MTFDKVELEVSTHTAAESAMRSFFLSWATLSVALKSVRL